MGEFVSLTKPTAVGDSGHLEWGQDASDVLNDATSAATPSTLAGRDADGRMKVADPASADDVATKGYADGLRGQAAAVDAKTGAYTPVLTDRGKVLTMTSASGVAITLPQNSALAFPIGGEFTVINLGAGTLTFSAGSGATVTGSTSSVTNVGKRVIKIGTNAWHVI